MNNKSNVEIKTSINDRMVKYELDSITPLSGNIKSPHILCLEVEKSNMQFFIKSNNIQSECESKVLFNAIADAALNCATYIPGAICGFSTFDAVYFCIMNTKEHKKHDNYITFASSAMTIEFNKAFNGSTPLLFNARLVTLPNSFEVKNYFIWRQIKHLRSTVYNFLSKYGINPPSSNDRIIPFDELLQKAKSNEHWSEVDEESQNGVFIRQYECLGANGKWFDDWKDKKIRVAVSEYQATSTKMDEGGPSNPFRDWINTDRVISNDTVDGKGALDVLRNEAAAQDGLLTIDKHTYYINKEYVEDKTPEYLLSA